MTSVSGNVCGYYRKNQTDAWSVVGCDYVPGLARAANVGFAVTSHADGTLATAKFSSARAGVLPAFNSNRVNTNLGSATTDYTKYAVSGSGADIWGTADGLMYVSKSLTGDGTITARVRSIQNVHAWSKAGVMFRETLDAGSKQVDMIVSAAKGAAMQYRNLTGGASASVAIIPGAAPGWVRLTRAGDVFTGAWSKDGVTWTTLGSTTIAMGSTISVGLAVTSHNAAATADGVFDDVVISQ
jgi:regulation of enolase protein 1 (concanavalin A-like superfamily)